MATVTLAELTKVYGDGTRAVSAVDLEIPDGALMVLVGPSGCGKTTVLRMIAGLETITGGTVAIADRIVNNVSPRDREIAMVFQNYALYPHLSVRDNMGFSLKLRRVKRQEIDARVREAAKVLDLTGLLAKKPAQLSGGQRQRVAIGRAIVREPQVFLMDEPLSNLDAKLRVQLRAEIARLQRRLGVTTIYVTHDQTEAMTMGDRVAVLRKGVLEQVDAPQALYDRPATLFVAGFIGSPAMNLAQATVNWSSDGPHVEFGEIRLCIADEALAARPGLKRFDGREVVLGIRPEDLEDAALVSEVPEDRRFKAVVDLRESLGSEALVHFGVDSPTVLTEDTKELASDTDAVAVSEIEAEHRERRTMFIARMHSRTRAQEGEPIEVAVDTRAVHFFDPATGHGIYA
jgi:multiple sugar transport system ATP-binding protein